jgi:Limiting CO2-inducible proteins B/C beta carbonyic anhydrases
VLTCGVTGIGAGLSHAPIDARGRERYIFFAFPHIAVDEKGEPAAIFRPGREGKSSACGALMYATSAVQVRIASLVRHAFLQCQWLRAAR